MTLNNCTVVCTAFWNELHKAGGQVILYPSTRLKIASRKTHRTRNSKHLNMLSLCGVVLVNYINKDTSIGSTGGAVHQTRRISSKVDLACVSNDPSLPIVRALDLMIRCVALPVKNDQYADRLFLGPGIWKTTVKSHAIEGKNRSLRAFTVDHRICIVMNRATFLLTLWTPIYHYLAAPSPKVTGPISEAWVCLSIFV